MFFETMGEPSFELYSTRFKFEIPKIPKVISKLKSLKSIEYLSNKENLKENEFILPIYTSKQLKSLYTYLEKNIDKIINEFKINSNSSKKAINSIDKELSKYLPYGKI